MGPDDFHDLGLCPDCERDMTAGELHTAECELALAQDAADGDATALPEKIVGLTVTDLRRALRGVSGDALVAMDCEHGGGYRHPASTHGGLSAGMFVLTPQTRIDIAPEEVS